MSETILNQNGEETGLMTSPIESPQLSARDLVADLARLEGLEEIDHSTKRSANAKYWEANKGDVLYGLFIGWKMTEKADESTGEMKALPLAVLRTKVGDYVNGSTLIVDAFLGAKEGTSFRIECLGKKGRMKNFDIKFLD